MREMHVRDVVRHGLPFPCYPLNVGRRHVEKLGMGIDEARNEPGTGDAVDLRSLTRDPSRCRIRRLAIDRASLAGPSRDAACDIAGVNAALAERSYNLLAHIAAVSAIDDKGTGCGQRMRPARDLVWIASQCAGEHFIRLPKCVVASHIDDD